MTEEEIYPLAAPIFDKVRNMTEVERQAAYRQITTFVESMLRHPSETSKRWWEK